MIKTLHLPKGSTRDDVRRLTLEHVDRIVGEQLAKYEQSLLAGAEEHGSSLEDIASELDRARATRAEWRPNVIAAIDAALSEADPH